MNGCAPWPNTFNIGLVRPAKSSPTGNKSGLGQVHLARHGLHPVCVGGVIKEARDCRVAAECLLGERINLMDDDAHGVASASTVFKRDTKASWSASPRSKRLPIKNDGTAVT